jgi:hypothetical protein
MTKPVADDAIAQNTLATHPLSAVIEEASAACSEDRLDEDEDDLDDNIDKDMLDDPDALAALPANARAALEALRAKGARVYCRPCEHGSVIRIPGELCGDEDLFVDYFDDSPDWPDGVSPVVHEILEQHGLRGEWINCAIYGVWLDD